jgi:hypothetical protein
MYVIGKMIPVETILGMWGRDKGEKEGNEFKYNIFDILQEPL